MRETADELQKLLDNIEGVVEPNIEQRRALIEMLDTPGFKVLIGLLITSRQGLYVQLGNVQLATPEGVSRAAVLQGIIKGIDLVPQTLLDLMLPAQVGTEGAKDHSHG